MAGVSAKEIRNRIRSMEATRQITRAMEMVASSKLRRAQTLTSASRPYFDILSSVLDEIVETTRDISSPYLKEQSGNRVLYIVIAGDRGLAGGYNSNILKMVQHQIQSRNAVILPIGKKSLDFFRVRELPILSERYTEAADIDIDGCFCIARLVSKAFLRGEFDEIRVAYTRFVSALSQVPESRKLLPLSQKKHAHRTPSRCDTVYEPTAEDVFNAIVPEYLGGILYGALCESRAAEQAARRTAMDTATQNATQMINDLSVKYNRARQTAITQEITEIVAGA